MPEEVTIVKPDPKPGDEYKLDILARERQGSPIVDEKGNHFKGVDSLKVGTTIYVPWITGGYISGDVTKVVGKIVDTTIDRPGATNPVLTYDEEYGEWVNLGWINADALKHVNFD